MRLQVLSELAKKLLHLLVSIIYGFLELLTSFPVCTDPLIERLPSVDEAGATERMTDFTRAMSQLKPRERAMLWLAYAEGVSHREIADLLGLRPASLKPMLFRARRKLAALLGRAPEGGRP